MTVKIKGIKPLVVSRQPQKRKKGIIGAMLEIIVKDIKNKLGVVPVMESDETWEDWKGQV